jgi:hypothetical protein
MTCTNLSGFSATGVRGNGIKSYHIFGNVDISAATEVFETDFVLNGNIVGALPSVPTPVFFPV